MFGKNKRAKSDIIDLGSEVEYKVGNNWKSGIIHAIRKDEKSAITAYLVDNGKTHLEGEIITPKGEDNITYSQPVQVEVAPENIRLK